MFGKIKGLRRGLDEVYNRDGYLSWSSAFVSSALVASSFLASRAFTLARSLNSILPFAFNLKRIISGMRLISWPASPVTLRMVPSRTWGSVVSRISRILFQAAEIDLTWMSSQLKPRFSLRREVWRVIMVVTFHLLVVVVYIII